MSSMFPNHATELAGRTDNVQLFLIVIMGFWFIACNGAMIFMLLKYRRKGPDDKTSPIKGNHLLETAWTVIPTILVLIIFIYGIDVWSEMRQPPEDAMQIDVRGQKWAWSFIYGDDIIPGGRRVPSDLYVPQGVAVKLNMKSNDVLHSFYVPEFRIKEDVTPSWYTHLWFKADKVGDFRINCTEYCGNGHWRMSGTVHVLDPDTWQRFLKNEPLNPDERVRTPVEQGEYLYGKWACNGCHTTDGTPGIGPTLKGLMGRTEHFQDGASLVVDQSYVEESIKRPNAKIVAGFNSGQMPAFEEQLSQEDIDNLILFIQTLK